MPFIFQTDSWGKVYSNPMRDGQPAQIVYPIEEFQPMAAIVTSIGLSQDVNIQFMPTLQDVVYIYSFGDRMGEAVVQGIGFSKTCDNPARDQGAKEVMDFYDEHRAVEEGKVVTVNIGGRSLTGFLISMRLATADTALKTTSFTMRIAVLPKGSRPVADSGGGSGANLVGTQSGPVSTVTQQ